MDIYIDESGNFLVPAKGGRNLSCVGALVVREGSRDVLAARYASLVRFWGSRDKEIKGSSLCESQVAAVIALLVEARCLFFVCATEMSENDPSEMHRYQASQARCLTDDPTEKHPPKLRTQMAGIRKLYEAMPPQLFIQTVLLTDLIKRVIDLATMHFAMRGPASEAGAFRWVIDGKEEQKTKYETAWQLMAGGLIESRTIESPGVRIAEGDYSHFDRKFARGDQPWPAHLPRPNSRTPGQPGSTFDLKRVLYESMEFADSRTRPGLQLADIVTNAFRRALMGRLQPVGFARLGELMVHFEAAPFCLHLFSSGRERPRLPEYDAPAMLLKRRSRPAFA
jgi:hypothetical protein